MGCKGIFKFILHRIFEFTLVVLLIVLLPNIPPYTKFSDSFRISPAKPFEGKLALKEKLSEVEIWHKDDLEGPEGFAHYNGELYVSLLSGDVVKLKENHITPVVKFGKPCKGNDEQICGRPLGIQFDKTGTLYAADAYYGIFKVNVKSGEKERLVSPEDEINGKKPKLFNSIALASNGDFYWSDSSSEFYLHDGLYDLLADPSGRLIHYDAKTKKNKVLIDQISFANGVLLSDDEEFVLVAETGRNRIHRYYLKGPKKGKRDIFIDGLPGMPDNLNSDGQAGVLIPLVIAVDNDHPAPLQIISPFPLIKKFFARLLGLTELTFETINRIYPCEFAQRAVHFIGHFTSVTGIFSVKRVTILRVSKNGEILDSLHNLNNKLSSICEAHIFKDTMYFGSPFNNYIGKIPLSKIGWSDLSLDRKKRDISEDIPTSETTTPRPKSTSPPKQQTPLPKQTPPPKQQTQPPTQQTQVPNQQTTQPPKQETHQPKQQTQPPKQQTPLPTQQTPPPKQQAPPLKQQTPPVKQQAPPQKQQQAPPPKQQAPPPKQQSTPPKQQSTPPKQQAPPPKQQAPPPKQQTPPPKQQTPPPKQQTPPPKQQTLPPTQQASLPKEQIPSPKQQTPPPKQQTASPKQVPPPSQQNPSPQQQTPTPKQQAASKDSPPKARETSSKETPSKQESSTKEHKPTPKQAPPSQQQTPSPK